MRALTDSGASEATPATATFARYADVGLAALVVLIVAMMVVPLPTWLLDVLLASNMSLGVLLLLVALYLRDGLAFASFPTVLLITTLYRLALNISSTRLILLQADAGEVIAAFGGFVVRGNYVVGGVVFLILTIIQFVVIAKGAERVAEVGARFTLDAMPGKQMAIDAELRTGAITQDEAQLRRRAVQRESEFFGAMDGAMKFVKGDAIAGILIIVVNLLGGAAVGVGMHGLGLVESLRTYGLLTIGDGLVTQIPALLISTAAALVVTRVSAEQGGATLASDIARQVIRDPRALGVAAALLLGLAVTPGLPAVPFLVLAAAFFTLGRAARRANEGTRPDGTAPGADAGAATTARPGLVPLAVELGSGFGDDERLRVGAALHAARAVWVEAMGASAPEVVTVIREGLPARGYAVLVQEVPVVTGVLEADHGFVLAAPEALGAAGGRALATRDPVTGRRAAWLPFDASAAATRAGFDVLTAESVIARAFAAALRRRGHEFVGLEETQGLLDAQSRNTPSLVRAVVPKPVSLALMADVLRRLVEEQVSIRPLREILECLAVHAPLEKDPVALTELVRVALRRQISHRWARAGVLALYILPPEMEEAVRDGIQRTPAGSYLALSPALARDIVGALARQCTPGEDGRPVLLLAQGDVRRFVRRLIDVDLPDAVVLSYQELAPELSIQPLATLALA